MAAEKQLTIFVLSAGRPVLRQEVDPRLISPAGLDVARLVIASLSRGAESADLALPLVPQMDRNQRVAWGIPAVDQLDTDIRGTFERVMQGWPGQVFSVSDCNSGALHATGLLVPDDDSDQAQDCFSGLLRMLLLTAAVQQLNERDRAQPTGLKGFTASEVLAARPALLLDVQFVPSGEFGHCLLSLATHYCRILMETSGDSRRRLLAGLIEQLDSSYEKLAVGAQDVLVDYGAEAAGPLIAVFADKRPERRFHRARAAFTLGRIGPAAKDAIPVLIEALAERDPPVAGSSLGSSGVDEELAAFFAASSKPEWRANVNLQAAYGLSRMGSAAVPALIASLKDPRPSVRMDAARALEMMGSPDAAPAIPALIEATLDIDINVRGLAADALGKLRT